MAEKKDIREIFEAKARSGDGAYAIAFALMDLSDSQEATAKALQKLGLGNASTPFGAIEALGMQIEKAAEIVGEHLDGVASAINTSSD